MRNKLNLLLPIAVVVFFAVIAGFSLLHSGLPPTHDGEYHVIRFYLFNEALKDGNLYPRWAAHLNNGFGVPLFNFVYPWPNYAASILHSLKISFIDSFKLSMFMAIIIGGVFFYLWAKEFWGRLGGIVSSVFYTFSPYHFVDIYIRGSVGEVWALAFFPAFLWSFTNFVKTKRRVFLISCSLFLALIIFSHNILALMFFIFSLSYIAFLICKEKSKTYLILNTFYLILLGLGLSAIFWLPAIYETKYAVGLQIFDFTSHFPQLYQLLIPSWGSGFSGAGLQSELSYQIGVANLLAIFLSIIVLALQIKRKNNKFSHVIFFLFCFILVFFLMLDMSLPVWQAIPFMNYFQFPWRLLSLEILFASFLAGSIFSLNIGNKFIKLFFAVFLIFIAFILSMGYAKPAYYMQRNDNYYTTRSNFIDGTNSIGNVFNTIWFNQNLKKQKERIIIDKGEVKSSIIKSAYQAYLVSIITESKVTVNVAYFPSWTVFIDRKKIITKPDTNGLISFLISPGNHLIEVKFENTPIRKIANIIFLVSFFSIIAISVKWFNYGRKKGR